jgi:hypothetical protein
MDATQILTDRIQHEIDMDILREISEQVRVDLTKEIELAEKKFNNKIDRVINGLTNKIIHSDNSKQR